MILSWYYHHYHGTPLQGSLPPSQISQSSCLGEQKELKDVEGIQLWQRLARLGQSLWVPKTVPRFCRDDWVVVYRPVFQLCYASDICHTVHMANTPTKKTTEIATNLFHLPKQCSPQIHKPDWPCSTQPWINVCHNKLCLKLNPTALSHCTFSLPAFCYDTCQEDQEGYQFQQPGVLIWISLKGLGVTNSVWLKSAKAAEGSIQWQTATQHFERYKLWIGHYPRKAAEHIL